jgi:hypothetical protein
MSYPPQQQYVPQPPQKTNGLAVAGFVCSLIPCVSILGLILSAVGLNQISKDPNQGGKGLAIAGLVLGILGSIGWAIYYFAVIAVVSTGY